MTGGREGGESHIAREERIALDGTVLNADLTIPADPRGVVLFAHGSGSGRKSPRNRAVAAVLSRAGLATLLLDLLTAAEESTDALTGEHRFDIALLTERLVGATRWAGEHPALRTLPFGYFGASTGAAAALAAAAQLPDRISAVVSRGGRPDLAGDALGAVAAPTLLIVGGDDAEVLELNRSARARMQADTALEVVAGATHLFEEAGALEQVSELALRWFERHLDAHRAPEG